MGITKMLCVCIQGCGESNLGKLGHNAHEIWFSDFNLFLVNVLSPVGPDPSLVSIQSLTVKWTTLFICNHFNTNETKVALCMVHRFSGNK